jgi:hypothetical protein
MVGSTSTETLCPVSVTKVSCMVTVRNDARNGRGREYEYEYDPREEKRRLYVRFGVSRGRVHSHNYSTILS